MLIIFSSELFVGVEADYCTCSWARFLIIVFCDSFFENWKKYLNFRLVASLLVRKINKWVWIELAPKDSIPHIYIFCPPPEQLVSSLLEFQSYGNNVHIFVGICSRSLVPVRQQSEFVVSRNFLCEQSTRSRTSNFTIYFFAFFAINRCHTKVHFLWKFQSSKVR